MRNRNIWRWLMYLVGGIIAHLSVLSFQDSIYDIKIGSFYRASATSVEMFLSEESVRPGDRLWCAFHMKIAPGWHIYWRNPGQSGLPPKITWTVPPEIIVEETVWPIPERYLEGDLVCYVYRNEVLLLTSIKVNEKAPLGKYLIKAEIKWLECKEICVPASTNLTGSLIVSDKKVHSHKAGLIEEWLKDIPSSLDLNLDAFWVVDGQKTQLQVILPESLGWIPTDFWGYEAKGYSIEESIAKLEKISNGWLLCKQVIMIDETFPEMVQGLLVSTPENYGKPKKAVAVKLFPKLYTVNEAKKVEQTIIIPTQFGLLHVIFLAFIGGAILNLMPCVLPVVALKILNFVQQSASDKSTMRRLGVVYAIGVIIGFICLAGIAIGIQKTYGVSGWGVQMQSIPYRIILLTIIVLVALNFFGVFEVTLGSRLLSRASKLSMGEGTTGAFCTGILTTALATPCTAPALAVAVGWAVSQPPLMIILVFITIGLGLAFPYVVLSFYPGWLKFIPRPGPWMVYLKKAMGFPMLAVAAWLMDFTAPSLGPNGIMWLGIYLVILTAAMWILGEFFQNSLNKKLFPLIIVTALLLVDYFFILEGQLNWRKIDISSKNTTRDIVWFDWSPERVLAARKAGQVVIVEFTADWCITCKWLEKWVLNTPRVKEKIHSLNILALKADFTNFDPQIAKTLQEFGRSGVPLVVVYPANLHSPPTILPSVFTVQQLINAIDKALTQ